MANNDLNDALKHVRESYRFLWHYHKRVNSIIEHIRLGHGLNVWENYPSRWSNPPRKLSSRHWTWDAFPFHGFDIWFNALGGDCVPENGDVLLHLKIDTDSAFPSEMHGDLSPDKIKNTGESLLIYRLLICEENPDKIYWNSETDWDEYKHLIENGFHLIKKAFNLSELASKSDIDHIFRPLFSDLETSSKLTISKFDEFRQHLDA